MSQPHASIRELTAFMAGATGRRCWHVSVGGVTLPRFGLALGRRILRGSPLRNKAQPTVFRRYRPDVAIYVWCSWRLESRNRFVASSQSAERVLVKGLNQLVGRRLSGAEVVPPVWDLVLHFDRAMCLRVFCDRDPREKSSPGNWDATIGPRGLFVGPGRHAVIRKVPFE